MRIIIGIMMGQNTALELFVRPPRNPYTRIPELCKHSGMRFFTRAARKNLREPILPRIKLSIARGACGFLD